MDNVSFIDVKQSDGTTVKYAIIDRGNEEFTSMPKAYYDAMQAERSTPIDAAE
jgi:hypothetical protein